MTRRLNEWIRRLSEPLSHIFPFVQQHAGHGHDLVWWIVAPAVVLLVMVFPFAKIAKRFKAQPDA